MGLASHAIGPVCIIEETHQLFLEQSGENKQQEGAPQWKPPKNMEEREYQRLEVCRTQCLQLLHLFRPITYTAPEPEEHVDIAVDVYELMVQYVKEAEQYVRYEDDNQEEIKERQRCWRQK